MNRQLSTAVEAAIFQATDRPAAIVSTASLSGGCINQAHQIVLTDGRSYFLKSNQAAPHSMFATEAEGLQALANTKTIDVPNVIAIDPLGHFLVLEAIETGQPNPDFWTTFGRQLAQLHRAGSAPSFGFSSDNFLGSTPQPNTPNSDWVEFWCHNRIQFQFDLARQQGDALERYRLPLLNRVPALLATDQRPALIHGDLWSGNYLVSSSGHPVLIDPAVYFAHRESEFGMTTLFGGFDQQFYHAYQDTWPLAEGWEERVEIYRLYHLLNHLNLFGKSYLSGCIEILKKFV